MEHSINYLIQSLIFISASLFLLGTPGLGVAQDSPPLSGQVVDAGTNLPLKAAHVHLVGTSEYDVTDELGKFEFDGLPPGGYTLTVTFIGYQTEHREGIVVSPLIPAFVKISLQPEDIPLPEVEVHAASSLSQGILAGGSLVTGEELRRHDPHNIVYALEKTGLVTVTSDGNPGGPETVSVRGSSSNQVTVLIDGQPLNQAMDGTADLSSVALSEIRQVEIYPQAPPSLSAQAVGGVINILTIPPGSQQYRIDSGFSQYGERKAALSINRSTGGWGFWGMLEHRESSGEYKYRVVPDDGLDYFTRYVDETRTRHNAGYRRDHLSLKINPPGMLSMSYRGSILFRENPDYLPESVLEHESTTGDDRHELTIKMAKGRSRLMPEATIQTKSYHLEAITDYGDQYPLLYNESDIFGEVYGGDVRWKTHYLLWDDIAFGGGARLERVWSNELNQGYAERYHQFGYFQTQGRLVEKKHWPCGISLFSGVRTDLYRDYNAFIYPRLSLEIDGGDKLYWTLSLQSAGAYRLPSFNALFWQEDLQAEGNPNLKPERSRNDEVSFHLGYRAQEVGITYFNRKLKDLIYWRLDFDDRWKPLNIAEANIYGIEYHYKLHMDWHEYQLKINVFHRWMKAINRTGDPNTDGMLLSYRPVHSTTFSCQQETPYLNVDLSARWVGKRYTNEANTKSLSPYKIWDVGISKDLPLGADRTILSLHLQIRNLFDESYRIVESAPVPLREFWGGIALEKTF